MLTLLIIFGTFLFSTPLAAYVTGRVTMPFAQLIEEVYNSQTFIELLYKYQREEFSKDKRKLFCKRVGIFSLFCFWPTAIFTLISLPFYKRGQNKAKKLIEREKALALAEAELKTIAAKEGWTLTRA